MFRNLADPTTRPPPSGTLNTRTLTGTTLTAPQHPLLRRHRLPKYSPLLQFLPPVLPQLKRRKPKPALPMRTRRRARSVRAGVRAMKRSTKTRPSAKRRRRKRRLLRRRQRRTRERARVVMTATPTNRLRERCTSE